MIGTYKVAQKLTATKTLSWLAVYRTARQISAHFDCSYYLSQTDDAEAHARPVLHYVRFGAANGLDPTPDFSTGYYLEQNQDVLRSAVNPFWHYLRFGQFEGRAARPPVTLSETLDESEAKVDEIRTIADAFDVTFYRARYPSLPDTDDEVIAHYLKLGWVLGYDPCDWFSTRDYILANPDVAEARINPFVHYLLVGAAEGRKLAIEADEPISFEESLNIQANELRPEFDEAFYLQSNQDVAKAGVDPVVHYLAEGVREGRDPHPDFSTRYYLESNPDLQGADINPFLHYIRTGRSEGRYAKHPAGDKVDILAEFSNFDELADSWRRTDQLGDLLSKDDLAEVLGGEVAQRRLILSICHDDYQKVAGGIQLCIAKEVSLANDVGDSYLAILPWQPLPCLATLDQATDVAVSLILNGERVGVTLMTTLCDSIAQFAQTGAQVETVVHQLLGHSIEQIIDLVLSTGHASCSLWLHDFITVCPSYTLLRNNLDFCAAPRVDSNACSICIYGQERITHQERIVKLFAALDVSVLAPSTVTKNIWQEASGLTPASIKVVPHVRLRWKARPEPLDDAAFSDIKIAFVGTQAEHKGWPTFTALSKTILPHETSFFYFGTDARKLNGVRHVPVHVKSENPAAMTDALAHENIDFVIHWAAWPETFSFTTYEAIAAGAFVITNEVSGNVAATINRTGHGVILKDHADLVTFLSGSDGRLKDVLKMRRRLHATQVAHAIPSSLSFQKAGIGR